MNRRERRRKQAIGRKALRRCGRRDSALKTALLGTATAGLLTTAALDEAASQVVLDPPGTIPAQCTVLGGVAICEGDLSAGIDADGPPLNNLTIRNLTAAISPTTASTDGVSAIHTGNGNLDVFVDTGGFGISGASGFGSDGIYFEVNGDGNASLTSIGDITTQTGESNDGISGSLTGNGNLTISSTGNLTTQGGTASDAILAELFGNGDIAVTSVGDLVAQGVTLSGAEGIDAFLFGNGKITINSTGDITSTSDRGIDAFLVGNGDISIESAGTVTTLSNGLNGKIQGNGNVSINSTGTVKTTGREADGIRGRVIGSGDVTIKSTGDITTAGTASDGIEAQVSSGLGNLRVESNGNISTSGNSGQGISTLTSGGTIYIDSTGNITTSGVNVAGGIRAVSTRSGGSVTVKSTGNITTSGKESDGIEAVELGAGNVFVDVDGNITTNGQDSPDIHVTETGVGDVTVGVNGAITTNGQDSPGILIDEQGVGDVTVDVNGNLSITGLFTGNRGIEIDESDDGNVTVTLFGDVESTDGSISVDEAGTGNVIINSLGNLTTTFGNDEVFGITENGAGNVIISSTGILTSDDDIFEVIETGTGDISITTTGKVTAGLNGDRVGDGFDLREEGDGSITITSVGDITTSNNQDGDGFDLNEKGAGGITITSTGNITATGLNGDGLDIRNDAPSVNTFTLIDGVVTGGTGGAGANLAATLGANTLNTRGSVTLSSLSGFAVNDGTADTTINNFGVLNTVANGAIQLGGGANALNNRLGGTFNSGLTVNLGAGNLFTNEGVVSPGGSINLLTTNITGNVIQTATGEYLVDVDAGPPTADRVNVSGTAALAGKVRPQFTSLPTTPNQVTILSATGGTTDNGLGLITSPALVASLGFPNANDVVLSYSVEFAGSVSGLNPNQTSLVNYFNRAFNAGSGSLNDVLLALLNSPTDVASYGTALNQFLPEIYPNADMATLFASQDFSDDLFSCPSFGEGATAISEGQCIWLRPQGGVLDFSGTSDNIGFQDTAGGLSAGAQFALAPGWYGNVGLGYELGKLETDTNAQSTSHRFQGGVAIKYQDGPWLIGGAVSGGVASYETDRPIAVGAFSATAQSDHQVRFATGQLRAAYEADYGLFYARPSVDARLTYLNRQGLTETGGGAANLSVADGNGTYFSISPAIEVGRTFTNDDKTTVRPFAKAGFTYFTDSDEALTTQFVAAPAGIGNFSTVSDFGTWFADIEAGVEILTGNRTSLSLGYEGTISDTVSEHGAHAKGTVRF